MTQKTANNGTSRVPTAPSRVGAPRPRLHLTSNAGREQLPVPQRCRSDTTPSAYPHALRAALRSRRPETGAGLWVPGSSAPVLPGPVHPRQGGREGLRPTRLQAGQPSEEGPVPSWGGGVKRSRLRLLQLSPGAPGPGRRRAPGSERGGWASEGRAALGRDRDARGRAGALQAASRGGPSGRERAGRLRSSQTGGRRAPAAAPRLQCVCAHKLRAFVRVFNYTSNQDTKPPLQASWCLESPGLSVHWR